MDVATVALSGIISAVSSICIMIVFYSRWILPYLTGITESIPIQVKELVFPFVKETVDGMQNELKETVAQVSASVRATSARLSRTMNQAEEYLNSQGVVLDPENPQSIDTASASLKERYGATMAMQLIDKLLTSYANRPQKPADTAVSDGWN